MNANHETVGDVPPPSDLPAMFRRAGLGVIDAQAVIYEYCAEQLERSLTSHARESAAQVGVPSEMRWFPRPGYSDEARLAGRAYANGWNACRAAMLSAAPAPAAEPIKCAACGDTGIVGGFGVRMECWRCDAIAPQPAPSDAPEPASVESAQACTWPDCSCYHTKDTDPDRYQYPPPCPRDPESSDAPASPQPDTPTHVYITDGGATVVGDPNSDDHNCDAMGCGHAHVLARLPFTDLRPKQSASPQAAQGDVEALARDWEAAADRASARARRADNGLVEWERDKEMTICDSLRACATEMRYRLASAQPATPHVPSAQVWLEANGRAASKAWIDGWNCCRFEFSQPATSKPAAEFKVGDRVEWITAEDFGRVIGACRKRIESANRNHGEQWKNGARMAVNFIELRGLRRLTGGSHD